MKQFFGAGILLLFFLTFALSFCVLEFDVGNNESISNTTVHYAERETGEIGKLSVTVPERLAKSFSEIFSSFRTIAKALPFFAVDMAKEVFNESKTVFLLLDTTLNNPAKEGAVLT